MYGTAAKCIILRLSPCYDNTFCSDALCSVGITATVSLQYLGPQLHGNDRRKSVAENRQDFPMINEERVKVEAMQRFMLIALLRKYLQLCELKK